jgi:hypothetical protein
MESVVDEMRTDFDVPMLRVATDQEYQPRLDEIIDFVVRDHRTRQHAINSPLWTRSGALNATTTAATPSRSRWPPPLRRLNEVSMALREVLPATCAS